MPAQVQTFFIAHPANSRAHLMLAKLMAEKSRAGLLDQKARTALWLEPTNPWARDIHARILSEQNKQALALKELSRSVFLSPTTASHFYLAKDRVRALSKREREAVEQGFDMALDSGFVDAAQGLGEYYQFLGEPAKEANAYLRGAAMTTDPSMRLGLLLNAGFAFSRAKEWSNAVNALQKAAEISPANPTSYQALMEVYGATHDLTTAKALIGVALDRGVDPFPLYFALAQLQKNCGQVIDAQASLLQAIKFRPNDFDTRLSLGELYRQQGELDRAIMWLDRAVQSNPGSVTALAELADAQQASYRYYEAERTYQKALKVAPKDAGLRAVHASFERRLKQAEAER
jgi:tetratricopeptide (TPR) repeat protein